VSANGRLLERDDVRNVNVTIMRTVQARSLALAPATAPRLVELHRPVEAESTVRDAIDRELSSPTQRRSEHPRQPSRTTMSSKPAAEAAILRAARFMIAGAVELGSALPRMPSGFRR
jgi:hypothetical protein